MGRTLAPVPPKERPRSAMKLSASGIFSKGMPTTSAASRAVKMTLPFPNFSEHSARARNSSGEKIPATVTTLPEKHSVSQLRRKPLPLTLAIWSFVNAIVWSFQISDALIESLTRLKKYDIILKVLYHYTIIWLSSQEIRAKKEKNE